VEQKCRLAVSFANRLAVSIVDRLAVQKCRRAPPPPGPPCPTSHLAVKQRRQALYQQSQTALFIPQKSFPMHQPSNIQFQNTKHILLWLNMTQSTQPHITFINLISLHTFTTLNGWCIGQT